MSKFIWRQYNRCCLSEAVVEIRTKIIWKDGTQLTAASAEVPASYFPAELLKPPPEPVYNFPDSNNNSRADKNISILSSDEGSPFFSSII